MIDLATLTGAVIVALGSYNAGMYATDNKLADQLTKAGLATGEGVWRMPLSARYDRDINSDIADMKNVGKGREGGSITAAQFLKRYVGTTTWAHLDIADSASVSASMFAGMSCCSVMICIIADWNRL